MTCTPRPVKRSTKSFGAIAAITVVDVVVDRRRGRSAGSTGCDAERAGRAHRVRALAGGDQRLRRHAAVVEAVAAHLVLLDQHDRLAERRSGSRDRQAAGAGADDAEIGSDRPRVELPIAACCVRIMPLHALALHFLRATGIRATTPSSTKAMISSFVTSALVSIV